MARLGSLPLSLMFFALTVMLVKPFKNLENLKKTKQENPKKNF